MNFIALLESDGSTLKRVARTRGGEYAGACPWCGGEDRFRVWPERNGGRYWCRGCGKTGDCIQWLRERRGLSFMDACRYLGREPGMRSGSARHPEPAVWEPKEANAPLEAWQTRARTFLDQATAALWSEQGESMREWLRAKKGLQDATIREASLGYNPADIFAPRKSWGLAHELKEEGKERRQWLPRGLVIPLLRGGEIHRLRIRRDAPGDGARYVVIGGSSSAPMTMNFDGDATIIVESELDALLLSQEAGDLVGVVALGSVQAKPDKKTHEILKHKNLILVALDVDDAGAKASWSFWPEAYGVKAKRWPCILGKDPSEAQTNGLNIRAWVMAGLPQKLSPENTAKREIRIDNGKFLPFPSDWLQRYDEVQLERLAIMTVDGGLSDDEAVYKLRQCVI